MAIDDKKIVQSVYDLIFDSLTAQPTSGMAGRPAAEPDNTFLSLQLPGNPIDVEQFANPAGPNNPNGNTLAAENFSFLVDEIPKIEAIHSTTGQSVDRLYGQIVSANVRPTPVDPESREAYERAYNFLHSDGVDYNDLGQPITVKVDSPVYSNYKRKKQAYSNALISYLSTFLQFDFNDPADQRRWSFLGPTLQSPVDLAWGDLQAAHARRIEEKLAIVAQHQASSLSQIFSRARRRYEETARGSLIFGSGYTYHQSLPFPGNWFASSAADNFTQMTITSRKYYRTSTSRFSRYSAGGGAGWGLWRVGGGSSGEFRSYNSHSETEDVEVSFKLGRIEIRRPWLDPALLSLRNWSVAGAQPGFYSNGSFDDNDGVFPLLPTGFVVARDIQIRANWGETDYSYASRSTSHRASVGWGPFSLSGSYSSRTTTRTFRSQFDGTTISVPGIQIIGWISTLLPYCPPAEAGNVPMDDKSLGFLSVLE